jgi:Zn finger protein HypA/HybF involved in hydrogenase expression
MALAPCRECGKQISTEAGNCPSCGAPNPTGQAVSMKEVPIRKASSGGGQSCVLQGLGLLSLILAAATFFTVIGPLVFGAIGVGLLVWGQKVAYWYECSDCGTRLSGLRVQICPNCKTRLRGLVKR